MTYARVFFWSHNFVPLCEAQKIVLPNPIHNAAFVTGHSLSDDEDGNRVVLVKGYANGEAVTYVCKNDGTNYGNYVGKLVVPTYDAEGKINTLLQVGTDNLSSIYKAGGDSFTPDAQNASNYTIWSNKADDEFIKVPREVNVYIYNENNTRDKFDIDGYIGYIQYNEAEDKWWLDDEEIAESDITVTYYEYDVNIADVVYYISK